jgi:hypothetical protein
MGYLPPLFTTYMGTGYTVWLSVPLLLAGCWSAAREKRALLLLCGAIVLGPILMSLQGVSVDSCCRRRPVSIFLCPPLLILHGEIGWLAGMFGYEGHRRLQPGVSRRLLLYVGRPTSVHPVFSL